MATLNPFDLLGDDAEDPSQLAVSIEKIDKSKKSGPVSGFPAKSAPKLPSKPLPPAQAGEVSSHKSIFDQKNSIFIT